MIESVKTKKDTAALLAVRLHVLLLVETNLEYLDVLKLDRLILSCVQVQGLGTTLLFTHSDIVYWLTNKHVSRVSKNLSLRQDTSSNGRAAAGTASSHTSVRYLGRKPAKLRPIAKLNNFLTKKAAFCNFWPFGLSFPFILAFWAFISFHFGLLGIHFLSFWPFGLSFPFILAFWAFISCHFGLLGFHFFSFWPFGPSFPFILVFWAFISFHFGLLGLHFLHFWLVWAATWNLRHKLPKTARFLIKFKQILSAPRPAAFCNFWPFGPSFPFILAFWASFPFILVFWALHKLPKTARFLIKFKQILSAPRPAAFCNFWLFGLHFLSFWPFGPSFPFILVFWVFISFHFGLLGFYFLSFWPFGLSFRFILAFWAFISFHFGLLGIHFLSFWLFGPSFLFILAFWAFISFIFGLSGLPRAVSFTSCQERPVPNEI